MDFINSIIRVGLFIVTLTVVIGCTTNKLVEHTNVRNYQHIYINKYIKGVISDSGLTTLCFHGSNTIDSRDDIEKLNDNSMYDFTFTYQLDIRKPGNKLTYNSLDSIKKRTYAGCDNFPDGHNIVYVKDIPNNFTYQDIYDQYNNVSFYSEHTTGNTQSSTLYLTLGNNQRHVSITIENGYAVDGSECKLCYAGLPFTVAFDIITFPFQIIWFAYEVAYRGH